MKKAYILLLTVFVIAISTPAQAEYKIVHAGNAVKSNVPTPDYTFADIYQRQLDYRERRIELHAQLKARQKAFAEPSLAAYRQYREDLDKLHDSFEDE